jgi:predicted AlkP superfamily pyrophosphatase or phosphodiesterase
MRLWNLARSVGIAGVLAWALGATAACGSTPGQSLGTNVAAGPVAPVEPPRLVVVIVVDQLGSWVLTHYLRHLPADGLLRRAVERGAVFHVEYGYAGTYTAPGHGSIATGTTPSVHGIGSNEKWRDGVEVAVVDDGEHGIVGLEGKFASPTMLLAETVAEALVRQHPDAKVVSVSMKARAAILSVGRVGDAVLFYDHRARGFTTSHFYAPDGALPEWATRFFDARPIEELFGAWTPLRPEGYARLLGPDAAPGEGQWHGLAASFPHEPGRGPSPYQALRATPQTTDYLVDLALAGVEAEALGADDVPDLLVVGVSANDYVGHVFGPHSWEYFDTLLRMDRTLQSLVERLEARGPVSFLITSDHGVAAMPEHTEAEGRASSRLLKRDVVRLVETALGETLGAGPWVDAYVPPLVVLSESACAGEQRDRCVQAAVAALEASPAVHAAYDVREAAALRANADPVASLVGRSIPPEPPGDVFVVPALHIVPEVGDTTGGTSHGTPWDYDRRVPAIYFGPNVEPTVGLESLEQTRVATTVAALLGIEPPAQASPTPLPGVVRR